MTDTPPWLHHDIFWMPVNFESCTTQQRLAT